MLSQIVPQSHTDLPTPAHTTPGTRIYTPPPKKMCKNCCRGIYKTFECVPIVAIIGLLATAAGYYLITANVDDMVDGLRDYGVQTDNLKDYLRYSGFTILGMNAIVLFFALFSTGCCRRSLFSHEETPNANACFKVMLGPITQSIFFCLTICGIVLAFTIVLASLICVVVALFTGGVCSHKLDYTLPADQCPSGLNPADCTVKLEGSELMGQIVQYAELPKAFSDPDKSTEVNGAALCDNNSSFKEGSIKTLLGFTLVLAAQIFILIKVVHTFTSICWELAPEKEPPVAKHAQAFVEPTCPTNRI